MIKTHSDDPDVAAAAGRAASIVARVLGDLPQAKAFDYGGHHLRLGEYDVCNRCTMPIAEAQAAEAALRDQAEQTEDEEVRAHINLAADLFHLEAEAAVVRAELHNGQNSEKILNEVLGFVYNRNIHDSYDHAHHGGDQ